MLGWRRSQGVKNNLALCQIIDAKLHIGDVRRFFFGSRTKECEAPSAARRLKFTSYQIPWKMNLREFVIGVDQYQCRTTTSDRQDIVVNERRGVASRFCDYPFRPGLLFE